MAAINSKVFVFSLAVSSALMLSNAALAGPPYFTDDPEPTDHLNYEIYAFTGGAKAIDGSSGQAGFDLNYGGAEDLQLTMVIPFAYSLPRIGAGIAGFGDLQIAAKYKFLHQEDFGLDVAVFPRVFLPTNSTPALGSKHASLLLPLFVQKDWGDWSVFGGGGCTLNRGGTSQDFCQAGLVVARRVLPQLQLGLEFFHLTPDTKGGRQSSGLGFGAIYDLSENYHLMAWGGPGIQNAVSTTQASWYAALLFTF